MSKLFYSVDLNWYNFKQEDSFFVEGWLFASDEKIARIGVYDQNDKEIPSRVKWKERPDLVEARPDLVVPDLPGFTLQIPGVAQWMDEKLQKLEIRAVHGSTCQTIGTLEGKNIREAVADSTILYQIDIQQFLGTELELQGWFVDQKGTNHIRIVDGNGQEIPANIRRMARRDVAEQYEEYVDGDALIGFLIKVSKKDMTTRMVRVLFESSQVQKAYDVDMKWMERKLTQRGRLYNALGPGQWKDNLEFIKEHDFHTFVEQVKKDVFLGYEDYSMWVKNHRPDVEQMKLQKETVFALHPKISIAIPLYNTPLPYLKIILDSIVEQTYPHWELCLADGSPNDRVEKYIASRYRRYVKDGRLKYTRLTENKGISENTNGAIALATGDYIMLSDHDDIVEQGALYEMAKAINENPGLDILYTDEDKITMDGKSYFDPNFKTDFNPFMLECNNYICHIFVVRKTIMEAIGGFRSDYDGAQDYDLILRCWESTSKERICHIPKMLYHWRSHPNSTATNPESKRYAYEAGARALKDHFRRIGVEAQAEITENLGFYRIHRKVQGNPMVSILIPNMDHVEDLERCLSSITEKTTYDNYEILVVENNSQDPETFAYYEKMEKQYPRCKKITWEGSFNYAAINNYAAKKARGEYLLFLNNDVELISGGWMEEFLGICQLSQVGIVGAKLYYPDKTIQHAGVILGMGGVAGHMLTGTSGYVGRCTMQQNLTAVTAACMMMRAKVFAQVGGFDENFVVAYNDVDLCMKTIQSGHEVVYTPYVELFHFESKSRGLEDTREKQERLAGEAKRLREKWPEIFQKGDPFYNRNLSLEDGNCSPKVS